MMEYQPFQWNEFHGGITDNFIDTVPIRYKEADNFLVTENRKLYTRPGSQTWNPTAIPSGNQRINAKIDHFGEVLVVSATKIFYGQSVWASPLVGPTGNDVFPGATTTSVVSWAQWNNITYVTNDSYATPMKIYTPLAGTPRVVNAMLPQINSGPIDLSLAPGTNSYIYKFLYTFEYEVQGVTLRDFGATAFKSISNREAPDVAAVFINTMPALANGLTDNFDTATIKIFIYRTVNNGTQFFKIGEVTNGIPNFADTFADSVIVNNSLIYTDGGILDNERVFAKSIHVTDNIGYAANIKNTAGEFIQNRVMQSIPGIPHAFNSALFQDIDDNIVCVSSVGETAVLLCQRSIYRLDGTFNSKGESTLKSQKIESTVGCIGLSSVVQIQRGIVFAGEGGFYFTDGWEVRKISQAFNTRYKGIVLTAEQKRRLYGTFDRFTKRVAWAVQETGETDVNKLYVLDTRYGLGVAGDDLEDVQVCFTTWSGGVNFAPCAILFVNGELLRSDKRGYVLVHREGVTSDLIIDTTIATTLWDRATIIWRWRSMASSMGTPLRKKFVPKMVISAQNVTNASIQITSINDASALGYDLKPLVFRKNCTWGDISVVWDDALAVWNFQGMIEETRLFQSEGLRCNYKQIEVTNAYVQIFTSDSIGTVTVNSINKTVVLDNIIDYTWPINIRDHFIYFEDSNYLEGFKIVARTNTTITIADPDVIIEEDKFNSRFLVRGYPKDEILNLVSVAVWYAYLGEPNQYKAESAGDPPG